MNASLQEARSRKWGSRFGALACILSFFGFTVLDVFGPWLEKRHFDPESIADAKWGSLAIAAGLFCLVLWRVLPASGEVAALPLGGAAVPAPTNEDPLLVVRLFAFFCVWMTHATLLLKPTGAVWNADHFLLRGCAHQGMAIFFTLSGYLMGKAFGRGRYAVNRRGLLSFYANRIMRIVPLYLFAQITVVVLLRPEFLQMLKWTDLVRLLTFNYYTSPGQNGPISALWSLSTEMQYYLLAPFVYLLLSSWLRSGRTVAAGLLLTVLGGLGLRYFLFQLGTNWQEHRYTPLYANLDLFVVGLWFNGVMLFLEKIPFRRPTRLAWFFAAWILMAGLYMGACAFSGVGWFYVKMKGTWEAAAPGDLAYDYAPVAVALITGGIIVGLELGTRTCAAALTERSAKRRRWPLRILETLGVWTYGMYVWHPPVLETAQRLLVNEAAIGRYVQRNLVCLSIVVVSAVVTYHLVERPWAAKKIFRS